MFPTAAYLEDKDHIF